MDSNRRPLESEATAIPTEPPPLTTFSNFLASSVRQVGKRTTDLKHLRVSFRHLLHDCSKSLISELTDIGCQTCHTGEQSQNQDGKERSKKKSVKCKCCEFAKNTKKEFREIQKWRKCRAEKKCKQKHTKRAQQWGGHSLVDPSTPSSVQPWVRIPTRCENNHNVLCVILMMLLPI